MTETKNVEKSDLLLLLVYGLVGLMKIIPSLNWVTMVCVIGAIIVFCFRGDGIKIAPMFIFFNSSILYFEGVALVDIFFITYIVFRLIKRFKIFFMWQHSLLCFFSCYALFVVIQFEFMLAVEMILSFIALAFIVEELFYKERWYVFCKWYMLSLFVATIYGMCTYIAALHEPSNYGVFRYTLAFTDPNYAGMFLSIGFYILFFLKDLFRPIVRILGMTICILSILITVSSSAILCNIIVAILLCITLKSEDITIKKFFQKTLSKIIISVIIILFIVWLGIKYFPGLERSFFRFSEKVDMFLAGGIEMATTDRSIIWEEHLNFFWGQKNLLKILFGGNYLTDRGLDESLFTIVSHEVYIDSLICFGLVGTVFYIIEIARQLINKWKARNLSLCSKLQYAIVIIWIIYSFILSMFPFWGFLVMLLASTNEREENCEDQEIISEY